MRLGALNGLAAVLILLLSDDGAISIRQSAQIHFMHGMATLGCATFMNIGASGARFAPAFFLSGVTLYCVPAYAEAIGFAIPAALIKQFGLAAFITGWIILAWSARDIDRA